MDDDKFYEDDDLDDNFLTLSEKKAFDNIHDEVEQQKFMTSIVNTREAFKEVLSTERGQQVIWGILMSCNIYASTFSPNSWQAFNEGRRSIGLELIEQIVASSPEAWVNMQAKYLNIQSFKLDK